MVHVGPVSVAESGHNSGKRSQGREVVPETIRTVAGQRRRRRHRVHDSCVLETADMGLVHRVVCLLMSQLSAVPNVNYTAW